MRQELAAMAKSYDEQLDGQYVGNMGTVYKEGKGQVDALIWQYATADAKAEREANVNRIAANWGVSKETADNLYTAMAGVHTTAAIGGAVYGLKGIGEKPVIPAVKPDVKPTAPVVKPNGNVSINKGQQNKHIPGTNEYKIASDSGLNKSVITVPPDTLLSKIGTGQQVGKTPIGSPGSKERINYGKVIGNYIDPQTGVSTPTSNGIVHYGKNGVHIVPARPSE